MPLLMFKSYWHSNASKRYGIDHQQWLQDFWQVLVQKCIRKFNVKVKGSSRGMTTQMSSGSPIIQSAASWCFTIELTSHQILYSWFEFQEEWNRRAARSSLLYSTYHIIYAAQEMTMAAAKISTRYSVMYQPVTARSLAVSQANNN